MADPRLLEYIQKGMKMQVPPQQLKKQLIASGWKEMDVYYAMKEAGQMSLDHTETKEKKSFALPLILITFAILAGIVAWVWFF